MVALAVVLALPVAQLAVNPVAAPACCCPRPEQCKCPDHQRRAVDVPSLRTCRGKPGDVSVHKLPAFAAPPRVALATPVRAVATAVVPLPAPHGPPDPAERAAPS